MLFNRIMTYFGYFKESDIGFHFPIRKLDGTIIISSHYSDDYFKGALAANKSRMKKYVDVNQKEVARILRKARIDEKIKGRLHTIYNLKSSELKRKDFPPDDPKKIIIPVSTKLKGNETLVKFFKPYTQSAYTACVSDFRKNNQDSSPWEDSRILDYWGLNVNEDYYRSATCHHVCLLEMLEREKGKSFFDFFEAIPNEKIQDNTTAWIQMLQDQNRHVQDYVGNYLFLKKGFFDDAARQIDWPKGDPEKLYYKDKAYMKFLEDEIAKKLGGRKGIEHGYERLDRMSSIIT